MTAVKFTLVSQESWQLSSVKYCGRFLKERFVQENVWFFSQALGFWAMLAFLEASWKADIAGG